MTVGAVYEGVNELPKRANCPSWPGGVDAPIAEGEGADGVVVQVRQEFIEPPPRLRHSGCFAIIFLPQPPLLARRGNSRPSAIYSHPSMTARLSDSNTMVAVRTASTLVTRK